MHFRPWDLFRRMRREISIDFSSGIIDFENKNISIVQKQWKIRISVPMSYIAFLEATFCIAVGHIFRRLVFFDVDVFGFFVNFFVQNIEYMEYMDIKKVLFHYSLKQK